MVYAFVNFNCNLTGPGGSVNLGAGSAAAEEGISFEPLEDTVTPTIGADGSVVQSLHSTRAARITVRLLKTSPTNSQLQAMYNLQRTGSSFIGKNILVGADPIQGDSVTCRNVAFSKQPTLSWAKEVTVLEWEFIAEFMDAVLGALNTTNIVDTVSTILGSVSGGVLSPG